MISLFKFNELLMSLRNKMLNISSHVIETNFGAVLTVFRTKF